jgi:hypothetical protein
MHETKSKVGCNNVYIKVGQEELLNFQTLFYGNLRPSFTCSYQKIVQVELTSVKRKFAYHIIINISKKSKI